jgi:hypothetical protein
MVYLTTAAFRKSVGSRRVATELFGSQAFSEPIEQPSLSMAGLLDRTR